ncbi:hypothetical protein MBM_07332 [Drepanopeziza brunnea f. sp. 'multigermtubi' MB_m1]|uniref:2EXR domain-containing protein n=1 Tax=Marssonina brunnea f. sp. multigermtubi (strain MB_m1) TaxID=1072389 RepID=K1WNU0_MARBU|nr:uncharacterized protein MBM_07332 [Drepanopeziza brunnea f. sp. 'multigermtubi' MB_m1]EKD14611.1 hypothetical protein MBM_07332 [Drepanopeziza brunnea f. sp. 'multigermtubi' MB_m1]
MAAPISGSECFLEPANEAREEGAVVVQTTKTASQARADEEEVTFKHFPKLPAELRLRIWKVFSPLSTIHLIEFKHLYSYFIRAPESNEWMLRVPEQDTTLLGIWRETRYEATKHYRMIQGHGDGILQAFRPVRKCALVFRYRTIFRSPTRFSNWFNAHIDEVIGSVKHMVLEQKKSEGSLFNLDADFVDKRFANVDWRRLSCLESLDIAYLYSTRQLLLAI